MSNTNNPKGLNPKGTGPLFGVENNTGMMVTRNIMTYSDSKTFLKKLYNSMIYPATKIINAMNTNLEDGSSRASNYQIIMNIFNSVRVDFDLFDLTILESNANTKLMEESFKRNGFYYLNASPVIDKKTGDVCILFEMYKNPEEDANTFLDNIKIRNSEMLAFLYISQLLSLTLKNYKNKFTLANRAKMYMYQSNSKMDAGMRDEAAIALAKMAMDFHINSMILDNLNYRAAATTANEQDNFRYLKENSMILYNPDYTYKMTHLDILEKLLEDADFEFVDMNDKNQFPSEFGDSNDDNSDSDEDEDNEEEGTINRDSAYKTRQDDNEDDEEEYSEEEIDNKEEGKEPNDDDLVPNKPTSDDGKFLKVSFKKNKYKLFFMKMPPKKQNDRYEKLDSCDERTCDVMQNNIDYAMQKLKGTGIQETFENIGAPIKIDMEWEKDIIRFVDNMNNLTNSKRVENTWRKTNIFTKHIAMMPGKRPTYISTPTLYILFDQSGSMSNNVIGKINYIIKYFFDKKYAVNVLIHDDTQNADDVDVYEFRPGKNGAYNDNMKLDDLITHRIRMGGTSHKGVFDLMEVYIKEVTQRDKKYNSHYCFICSDLYSDIDSIWENYSWCKLISNTTIALCPEKDMKLPFGKTIYIS